MKKKTLHLNLKRQWFDMILSGEKTEEYREAKPYWCNRLLQHENPFVDTSIWTKMFGLLENPLSRINKMLINEECWYLNHDTITFSNGYAKDRPQFEIELKGISIRTGKTEWGAETGVKYFVLELGQILNKKNC